jgi:hypothetical protein
MTVREAVSAGSGAIGQVLIDSQKSVWYSENPNRFGESFSFDPMSFVSPRDLSTAYGVPLIISRVGTMSIKSDESGEVTTGYPAIYFDNNDSTFLPADIGDKNFVGFQIAGIVDGELEIVGIAEGIAEGSLWGSLFGELGGEGLFKIDNPFYLVDDIKEFFKDLWDGLIKALKDSLEKYWMIILIILIIVIAYFLLSTTGTGLAIYQSLKN